MEKQRTMARPLSRKLILGALVLLAIASAMTMLQDVFTMLFHRSRFYFSESFLFSSFWWIFVPLLYLQHRFVNSMRAVVPMAVASAVVFALFHLILFPALVWLISWMGYDHTFRYSQTFQFALSQYLYVLLFVYSLVPAGVFYFLKRQGVDTSNPDHIMSTSKVITGQLVVSSASGRTKIMTADILYFTANPPYVNIHHREKKYLQQGTLKSLLLELDTACFIRVHKSTIVNIRCVTSYASRMNGDYDLLMNDGARIRLSRNYAASFREHFARTHQDTTE